MFCPFASFIWFFGLASNCMNPPNKLSYEKKVVFDLIFLSRLDMKQLLLIFFMAVVCAGVSTPAGAVTDVDWEKAKAELKANPGSVSSKSNRGMTLLHIAAFYGRTDMVKLLLSYKADVNAKNIYGQTPLHMAALNGQEQTVELLLANKADVNAKDGHGDTPLGYALEKGYKNVAKLLVANGANVNTLKR